MPKPQPTTENVTSQRDFSAGEIDVAAKRDDANPIVKAAVRQGRNYRILNTKGLQNRFGRRALALESDRVEEISMGVGSTYYLAFPAGFLRVYDANWAQVFSEARPWSGSTAKDVVWAQDNTNSIYITFAGMQPRVLTWDGVTTWTAADYAETITSGGQKRTFFYRLSPKGVTMQPAGLTGLQNCTFSASMNLSNAHTGTRLRFCNRQVVITGVADATHCVIDIKEPLPGAQGFTFATDPTLKFNLGDEVQGTVTNSIGLVTQIDGAGKTMVVQLLSVSTSSAPPTIVRGSIVDSATLAFTIADTVTGTGGALVPTAVSVVSAPSPITIWDDEVMNGLRGWPASVAFDQNRLIFSDFPSVPSGIGWSWIGLPNDLFVGANPSAAIFELAPNKSRVRYVIPGMDASEFVFCDNRLYYIPITTQNPLKPGSVAFNTISEDECGAVQPRRAGEFILYTTAGLNQVMAIRIFGAYTRSYKTESVTELSAHLFSSIKAIAIMKASASFAERYAFVLDADGTVVVGKYTLDKNGELEGTIGWLPWSGNGGPQWVSCKGSSILFTTFYAPNGGIQIVEQIDDTRYLDASQKYNTQPAGLPIPGGKGPLWWLAGGTVDLMDGSLGTRMMGTYQVDGNGFLVPQNNAGEDFTSANLIVGQTWTATLEPFIPAVQAGQDVSQRMWKRRVSRFQVYVANSSGFLYQRLYSDQSGANLPAVGAAMGQRRIATWNVGEDPTQPPTLREQSYLFRPLGRSHDPRLTIVKDTPGPLTVLELSAEVTV